MKMKRILSCLLLLSLLATLSCGLSGCGQETDYLYIYNWGEYMPLGGLDEDGEPIPHIPELFEQYYEEVTGRRLEVVYSIFASNEEMYAKLKNGASKIDLVIPSDYMVERLISEGRLAELNFDNIPNIGNIADRFRAPDYDPSGAYSVPYTYGLVGLIYNKTMVDPADFEGEVSWRILWDEKYSGNLLTFNNARDAFGIAQYILSYENGKTAEDDNYINTSDPTRWDEALAMLEKQKPIVQAYVMDEVFNKMESGAAAMAPYYAGDFYTMQEINPDLELVYPKEGTNIFVDAFCIPKNTPDDRKEIAEMFINFARDTSVTIGGEEYNIAEDIAEYICYATPNEAVTTHTWDEEGEDGYDFIDEDGVLDSVLYPDLDGYNTYYFRNLPTDALEYQNSLWEKLKIGGGGDTGIYIATGAILAGVIGLIVFNYVKKKRHEKYY